MADNGTKVENVMNTGLRDINKEIPVLEQNMPNPANGETSIGYSIPASFKGGKMNVYDVKGQVVKTFELNAGKNMIQIRKGDLVNGIYFYELNIEGKRYEIRKMIIGETK
jgi:hypothetical protein